MAWGGEANCIYRVKRLNAQWNRLKMRLGGVEWSGVNEV